MADWMSTRLQGGSTYYHEELGIFRSYAEQAGLFLPSAPDALSRPPDEEGNEHQVWFDAAASSYLKATWPDFFGLLVIHRPNEESKASPIAYLERWHLHNELFGDEVSFLGALQSPDGLRLLIRQPAIEGSPATDEEIARFFASSGWKRFVIDGNTAYFDPERRIVVPDTHRGNLVLMSDAVLAPIDLSDPASQLLPLSVPISPGSIFHQEFSTPIHRAAALPPVPRSKARTRSTRARSPSLPRHSDIPPKISLPGPL